MAGWLENKWGLWVVSLTQVRRKHCNLNNQNYRYDQ